VVASEVRALAQRSAEAAREIKGLIATSVERIESGAGLVGEAVQGLDTMTQQNAALVEESSAAAATLRSQAEALRSAVEVFRLPA
jgi:methyl-accepting chemotaxis protein